MFRRGIAVLVVLAGFAAAPAAAGAATRSGQGLTLPPLCIKQPPLQLGLCP